MTSAVEVAGRLSEAQRRVVLAASAEPEWFPAMALTDRLVASAGALLALLMSKGLFERRSDPDVWGRSQYRFTPLGLEVRRILQGESRP